MRFAAACGEFEGQRHLEWISGLNCEDLWPVGRRAFAGCLAPSKTRPKSALPQSTATTRYSSCIPPAQFRNKFIRIKSHCMYIDLFQAGTHMCMFFFIVCSLADNQSRLSDLTTWTISCAGPWHCSRESNQPCWVPPKGEARAEWVGYSYIHIISLEFCPITYPIQKCN